jgi:hypothetical protein
MNATIVFGSALTSRSPRDIDVTYTGDWTPEREAVVRRWAQARRIRGWDSIAIDRHQQTAGLRGDMSIPSPTKTAPWEILEGAPEVYVEKQDSIAAILRRHPGDMRAARKELRACARQLNVGVTQQPETPWAEYTEGLRALRSAARHVLGGLEAIRQLPLGDLLAELVLRDPRPRGEYASRLAENTSGAAPEGSLHLVLDFRTGRVSTERGEDWTTSKSVIRELWPGPAAPKAPGRPTIGAPVLVRLDQDLLGRLDAFAGARGITRAAAIRRALDRYLRDTEDLEMRTSVRNETGAWVCVAIAPTSAEDFAAVEASADDFGGEKGQQVLLELVRDGSVLDTRVVTAS